MAQVVETDGAIGSAAEDAPKDFAGSHNRILSAITVYTEHTSCNRVYSVTSSLHCPRFPPCGTTKNAVVQISGGTVTLTISAGANDSGGIGINNAVGTPFKVSVITPAARCIVPPLGLNLVAQYKER